MDTKIDVEWFKQNLLPFPHGYKLEYRFFENGDFGDDERIEFEGNGKGGSIDFWSTGWLGIHLYDYNEENELFNVLLEPNEETKKIESFYKLRELIKVN